MARFGGANLDLLWQGFAHARLRPVRPDEQRRRAATQQRRHRSDAGLLVAAREQRHAELLRRRPTGTRVPSRRTSTSATTRPARRRSPTPTRRRPRRDAEDGEPRQHGAVRAEPEQPALELVQLPRRSHRATATVRFNVRTSGRASRGTSRSLRRRTSPRRRRARRSPVTRSARARTSRRPDDNEATNDGQTGANAGRWFVIRSRRRRPERHRESSGWASRALLMPGEQPLHGTPLVRRVRLPRPGRTRPTRPATGRSTPAGRRSSSSASDAFPSVNPRPVAPDMTLRYFDVSHPEVATHIKFVVTNNQCTGQTVVPGRPGQRPEHQRRLPCHPGPDRGGLPTTEHRGARHRSRGVRPELDRVRLEGHDRVASE